MRRSILLFNIILVLTLFIDGCSPSPVPTAAPIQPTSAPATVTVLSVVEYPVPVIFGVVTDLFDEPAADITVYLDDDERAQTDADGFLLIENATPGIHTMKLLGGEGWVPTQLSVDIPDCDDCFAPVWLHVTLSKIDFWPILQPSQASYEGGRVPIALHLGPGSVEEPQRIGAVMIAPEYLPEASNGEEFLMTVLGIHFTPSGLRFHAPITVETWIANSEPIRRTHNAGEIGDWYYADELPLEYFDWQQGRWIPAEKPALVDWETGKALITVDHFTEFRAQDTSISIADIEKIGFGIDKQGIKEEYKQYRPLLPKLYPQEKGTFVLEAGAKKTLELGITIGFEDELERLRQIAGEIGGKIGLSADEILKLLKGKLGISAILQYSTSEKFRTSFKTEQQVKYKYEVHNRKDMPVTYVYYQAYQFYYLKFRREFVIDKVLKRDHPQDVYNWRLPKYRFEHLRQYENRRERRRAYPDEFTVEVEEYEYVIAVPLPGSVIIKELNP